MKKLSDDFLNTQLTDHFTIYEMIRTQKNIENIPDRIAIQNLHSLCFNILEPTHKYLNTAIYITSAYRSQKLNAAVGGAYNSQHLVGQAADFKCNNMFEAAKFIRLNLIFDQLIYEFDEFKQLSWIHVSYNAMLNRMQVLKGLHNHSITSYEKA